MANSLDVKIVEEGWRNVVVEIVGVVDTNDISSPAILLSQMQNNDLSGPGRLVGFRVDEIDYTGSPALVTALHWNATTPQVIAQMSTQAELRYKSSGGLQPNRQAGGVDGTINVSTRGFTPGYVYGFTILVKLVKLYAP